MINSAAVNGNKQNQSIGNIVNDIYFFPSWEIVSSFTINLNRFFFFHKIINVNLLRKFALKNMLEKYSIRTMDSKTIAGMDIKLYKDCVYIVNLEINMKLAAVSSVEKLLQTAVEQAISETTDKKVLINISPKQKYKNKIKKILKNNGFEIEENQSDYEKQMFGEIYKLHIEVNNCSKNNEEKMHVLVNR